MELATDVIFLFLSSVNNDLPLYVFATGMGCEIRYVGYLYDQFQSQRNLDAQIKDLDAQFRGGEQIFNLKRPLLG